MQHELKIQPMFFDPVVSGIKTFELRLMDRPYSIGDTLYLREFYNGFYTGRYTYKRILYTLSGIGQFGLSNGYIILAIV